MQTTKTNGKPKSLVQGHIFNLTNLRFADGEAGEVYSFRDFYPHVDTTGIKKAIVLTQSCDLEHKKLPYINVGLLEPFTKKRASGNFFSDGEIRELFPQHNGTAFYNLETIYKYIAKDIGDLIQNNPDYSAHLIFLSVKARGGESYYFVNLTKLFPLRVENYDAVLKKVTHRAANGFEHLLAWRMAALYGRVGVDVYPADEATAIASKIASSLFDGVQSRVKATTFVKIADAAGFKGIKAALNNLRGANSDSAKQKAEAALAKELQRHASG